MRAELFDVKGLGGLSSPEDCGFVSFAKTRKGNAVFFEWFWSVWVLDFFKKLRVHTNDFVSPALLLLDGESEQIAACTTPHIAQLLFDNNIIVGKRPSYTTQLAQELDRGAIFSHTNTGSKSEWAVRFGALAVHQSKNINEMLSKFFKIAPKSNTNGKRLKFVHILQNYNYGYHNACTTQAIFRSFDLVGMVDRLGGANFPIIAGNFKIPHAVLKLPFFRRDVKKLSTDLERYGFLLDTEIDATSTFKAYNVQRTTNEGQAADQKALAVYS